MKPLFIYKYEKDSVKEQYHFFEMYNKKGGEIEKEFVDEQKEKQKEKREQEDDEISQMSATVKKTDKKEAVRNLLDDELAVKSQPNVQDALNKGLSRMFTRRARGSRMNERAPGSQKDEFDD